MKEIKVVKINDVIKHDTKCDKKNKITYNKLISNPEKIKEYLEKKSRKNTVINKIKEQKFKEQFKSEKKTKKNLRSKMKLKTLNRHTINKIFMQINNEKTIVNINKKNLLSLFREIIVTNNIQLSNKFIKNITRKQSILILSFLGIVNLNTKAPIPLLKNLLYNCITSTINIIC